MQTLLLRIKPNGRDCYNHESDTPNAMSWKLHEKIKNGLPPNK